MCVDNLMASFAAFCPAATLTLSPLMGSGMISFKADLSTTSSAVISFTESVQLPPSCYTEAQCTNLTAVLAAEPTVTNSHCGYNALSGCSCELTSTQPSMSNGTYEVQGTNVSLTNASSGKTEVDAFCVSGNTLSLVSRNASGATATAILVR
jgi:hypothetical protein